ncbi:hypothetical protein [Microvirga terricola]|uniref:Uncharacterized protein n=1 Tax=Microvirga terricola TaxID=2719797 RepID=A0ABX0V9K6_9HYPH|nr:hypothetical protein [Microvirga terricola]NIX76523.1 hypothetical protein [Microvirga terricola]
MKKTYEHNPRPVGGPIGFTLKDDRLTVDSGRKVQEVRLGAVETVRMTYEPGRLAQRVFRTKVTLKDGKTFAFGSLSWKNLVQAEELTTEYRAFTKNLFEAIARANPDARFIAGKPWWLWAATAIMSAASLLAMAYLIWRAFQMGATSVALLGGLFAVVGIWQIEPMIRLNKPRPFQPDAPPAELLPDTP